MRCVFEELCLIVQGEWAFPAQSQACSEGAEQSGSAQSLSEGDLGQMDLAAAQLGSGTVAVWESKGSGQN